MTSVVITLIGDDRSGLVDAISGVVADHGGNWDRSHLAELAGKFAGIVLVDVADDRVEDLLVALRRLEVDELLAITAERADRSSDDDADDTSAHVSLELTGADHPGIVKQISHVLAGLGVSIDELETSVVPAPQGEKLFVARALLVVPAGMQPSAVRAALEDVAPDLMVDVG